MLSAERLATLRAVVRHGSFSAAGEALALTQPAVSRQVSLLERQLGTQLVRRTQRGVYPTDAGRRLLVHADAILARLAQAEAEVSAVAALEVGRIRLGSFYTALVQLSGRAAARLCERHPGLVVEDELVDRRAAFDRLASGALDVAVVFEHDFEPAPPPGGVQVVDLFTDPVRVLLPTGHPLSERTTLRLADLGETSWIRAHEGSAARLIDRVAARAGVTPRLMLAGQGDEPVEGQALVVAGHGITFAHELNVLLDPAGLAVRPLADPGLPVRTVQAAFMEGQRAPGALAVLDVLREIGVEEARRRAAPDDGAG